MTGPIRHSPYAPSDLQRLLAPRSIAIVGASARPGSFGRSTLENLTQQYQGQIWLVNPQGTPIDGRQTHQSLRVLPAAPDCVVIAVPRDAVHGVIDDCVAIGAGGAVIYASGYAETARPEFVQMQDRLARTAADTGLKILGPNCIGMVNYVNGALASFNPCPPQERALPASIGLVSQSGAMAHALAQAVHHGVSFSHVLAAGNSCDVDVADMVAYLAAEPACKVIACIFEGMADPRRLLRAAELAWQANKPLLVYKLAVGEQGAAAAASHTGSLAGSYASYRTALERCGVVIVSALEALLETASFFAKAPSPRAAGVAVVATSGGAAIMCADKAEQYGVPLPQPGPQARTVLEQHIPEFGSARNPCDVTAQVVNNPASLSACCEQLAADPAYAALVLPQVMAYDKATPRNAMISDIVRRHGKIACNVWVTQWWEGPGAKEAQQDPGVALFRSADRCFEAIAAWQWREAQRGRTAFDSAVARHPAAKEVADALRASPAHAITEAPAKALLARYGVPVIGEALVRSVDEATQAAARIGFPVALKVQSPDILHKTDAGVLQLNVRDEAGLRRAYSHIMDKALMVARPDRIEGVVVQPMLDTGLEIMVGAKVDPLFGPLVLVGLGGIFVELLRDTQLAMAPVSAEQARAMLGRLKGAKALQGFRGSEAVDLVRLAEAIAAISQFAYDQQDVIAELDVNPLICRGGSVAAVDAVIIKKEAQRNAES